MRKPTLRPPNLNNIPVVKIGESGFVYGRTFTIEKSVTHQGWHSHSMGILASMDSGLVGVKSDQESMVLSSNMMIYIPANMRHLEKGMGIAISGWHICLPKERIKFMPKKMCVLEMSDLFLLLCRRIVSWGYIKKNSPIQKRFVSTFLDELESAKEAKHLTIPLPRHTGLYQVATRIITEAYDMNSIDYWAKIAGMSRRSFTRRFFEETGLTFVLWRQQAKLRFALLSLAGGQSVRETGSGLGYQNTSTFIAVFKKQFGCTPMQYVRSQKMGALGKGFHKK